VTTLHTSAACIFFNVDLAWHVSFEKFGGFIGSMTALIVQGSQKSEFASHRRGIFATSLPIVPALVRDSFIFYDRFHFHASRYPGAFPGRSQLAAGRQPA
jgi:hypothetical protein